MLDYVSMHQTASSQLLEVHACGNTDRWEPAAVPGARADVAGQASGPRQKAEDFAVLRQLGAH